MSTLFYKPCTFWWLSFNCASRILFFSANAYLTRYSSLARLVRRSSMPSPKSPMLNSYQEGREGVRLLATAPYRGFSSSQFSFSSISMVECLTSFLDPLDFAQYSLSIDPRRCSLSLGLFAPRNLRISSISPSRIYFSFSSALIRSFIPPIISWKPPFSLRFSLSCRSLFFSSECFEVSISSLDCCLTGWLISCYGYSGSLRSSQLVANCALSCSIQFLCQRRREWCFWVRVLTPSIWCLFCRSDCSSWSCCLPSPATCCCRSLSTVLMT